MAVETLHQSRARDALSREERERLLSSTNKETNAEQSFDLGSLSVSDEGKEQDGRATEAEIEVEIAL